MEDDGIDSGAVLMTEEDDTRSAVNKLILDYYKKFGRKRDLEQYFSLSTAQNDLKDPTGSFWRKMKIQEDSSDSGEKKSESSQELCRISIRCSLPEPSSSQDENTKTKSNPESPAKSPPIIVDDGVEDIVKKPDYEYEKSDDNQSHKSLDILLDTSINPRSPTSSITSQRKLEWDSLGDVGYANESDRKNSASSLSTLERLALKQQYSNNDAEKSSQLGQPTAHSTPLDENDNKYKSKKGMAKKTKIYKKDVDFVEVNFPQNNDSNPSHSVNVNLTKHISFNVQKDCDVIVENVTKDVNVKKSPDKVSVVTETTPQVKIDKEIQTSTLVKTKDRSRNSDTHKIEVLQQKMPVIMSLNTLRKRNRRKKVRVVRKKVNSKKKLYCEKSKDKGLDRSGEQLSEAESFEYMPGHVYNQNHLKLNQSKTVNAAGNKSSLESSGLPTTDSSKGSKHSFKKDLEKSIDLLKAAMQQKYNDDNLKTKLIKEVIQRLVNSKYRDDDSTTDFLSGLSFKSKEIGLRESNPTTSTSNGNTLDKGKTRPKKSILRMDKFNPNAIASTSQSAPNLPMATNSDKYFTSNLVKSLLTSNTETDASSREKISSDNGFVKTSSEELYQKYLEALKKEEAYKKHLRDKEVLLKQKLRSSNSAFRVPPHLENKINNRMKDLMQDLTRNNYDDGSGDASKLEGSSNFGHERFNRSQRSHSVFTLSSGHSENQSKKSNQKKRPQSDVGELSKAGTSKRDHYCCCPHHSLNIKGVTGSSTQVHIGDVPQDKSSNQVENHVRSQIMMKEPCRNVAHFVSDLVTGDVKYVCLCDKKVISEEIPDNYLIYKCSRLTNRGVQSDNMPYYPADKVVTECGNNKPPSKNIDQLYQASCSNGYNKYAQSVDSGSSDNISVKKPSKSSQTNFLLKMLCGKSSDRSIASFSSQKNIKNSKVEQCSEIQNKKLVVYESTRFVQTEISINPQISDPCLSDINILSDKDCFKLVTEQCREVSRHSSETDSRNREVQSDVEACTSNENFKQSYLKDVQLHSVTNLNKVQSEIDNINLRHQGDVPLTNENFPDNFTIPIQGTNMMLMVTIGSNMQASELKQSELINQGIETEKLNKIEESTSLIEECSKAVQDDNPIQEYIDTLNDEIDYNSHKILAKEDKNIFKVSCMASTFEVPRNKFNTHPQDKIKHFPRSNTDTKMLENINISQCDFFSNVESQHTNKYKEKQAPRKNIDNIDIKSCGVQSNLTENFNGVCPCGCALKMTKCRGVCGEMKDDYIIDTNRKEMEYNPADITSDHQIIGDSTIKEETFKILYDDKSDISDSKKSPAKNVIGTKDIGTQKDLPSETPNTLDLNEIKPIRICDCSKDSKCLGKCSISDYDKTSCDLKKKTTGLTSANTKANSQENCRNTNNTVKSTHNLDKELHGDVILNIASSTEAHIVTDASLTHDPVLNMIKDITKRYSKTDIEKNKRKKCFKEIVTVLNYLLDTDESSDYKQVNKDCGNSSDNTQVTKDCGNCNNPDNKESNIESGKASKIENHCVSCQTKIFVDKAVQLTAKKKKTVKPVTDSSDVPTSTDFPETSTDSVTCKVLNKIKKECERYHQKRCKSYSGKMCEASSSTSAHCDQCRRPHHCLCRVHKCKKPKNDKPKKPVAYNLIIQTSESLISEETVHNECQPLKNIIVKVPSRYKKLEKAPFKEVACKIEQKITMAQSPRCEKSHRSRSLPNECEMSSSGELRARSPACTIRDYLERNRPDFVEKCSQRQNCLKYISESRANERAAHRDLLSMHVDRESPLSALSLGELRHLAKEIGVDPSAHKQPKLISEREMKKRSEKIYKSLPEVVQKKEELKKENIKRTNLLMANIFKKNLQKKTLRGSVNLSNYSTVIKI
ncbi:hypothetical protein K1T71_011351 [Dendrolimus kikuchii]|uniref:Uncharacterized protein n=1 Tax=Dendrolimus kikuchii TaxID=765133 RepID=A0ACC1CNM2_9NEOP|nr:hypothetical protein K1T71_011351 [Dendrolimus kikuchii]